MGLNKNDVPADLFVVLDTVWEHIKPLSADELEGVMNTECVAACLEGMDLVLVAGRQDLQDWVTANRTAGLHRELIWILSSVKRYV